MPGKKRININCKNAVKRKAAVNFASEYKAMGEFISSAYTERGYTQKQFAELTGISTSNLRRMEHGEVEFRLTKLFLMARVLEITPAEMLAEADRIRRKLEKLGRPDRNCGESVTNYTKGWGEKVKNKKNEECLDGGDKRGKILVIKHYELRTGLNS